VRDGIQIELARKSKNMFGINGLHRIQQKSPDTSAGNEQKYCYVNCSVLEAFENTRAPVPDPRKNPVAGLVRPLVCWCASVQWLGVSAI
jgi:hypothetical protein